MNFRLFKKSQTQNNTGFTPMLKNFGTSLQDERGFTIAELIIVFAISMAITVVVISTYPNFSSKVEFENLALDIAIAIREMQVYGLGVREAGTGTGEFERAYGVHFDESSPSTFSSFIDANDDGIYNLGEELEIFSIKSNFSIKEVCVEAGCTTPVSVLDVSFKRPSPSANIMSGASGPYSYGSIEIESAKNGDTKLIKITDTGQIFAQ